MHAAVAIRIMLVRLVTVLLMGAALCAPAQADFQQSQRWFNLLTVDQRSDMQGYLVLLAYYGGMVDGDFGANTYSALIGWQSSLGFAPSGVLTQQQMELLDQMGSQAMSDMGMTLIDDLGGHLAIMLPMALLTEKFDRSNGTFYRDASGDFTAETFWHVSHKGSLAQHYAQATKPKAGKSVTYSTLRDDLYVVTGKENGRYYYELALADGRATAGFRFDYADRYQRIGGIASVFAASYSAPINPIEAARQTTQPMPAATTAAAPAVSPAVPEPAVTTKPKTTAPKNTLPSSSSEPGVNEFGNFLTFDDAPGVIAMIGDIGPSTPLDFRRALQSAPDATVLGLASNGGSVASALLMAYEVREREMLTWVAPETGCYSACAFMFLAGKERVAQGELGVHQVWGEQADASSAQTVVSDILEAFAAFGVRQEVASAMLRTRPEDMYIFDTAELEQWGLNTP